MAEGSRLGKNLMIRHLNSQGEIYITGWYAITSLLPPRMSLFRPDIWFPESLDFSAQLLARPKWLADYIAANILTAIFFSKPRVLMPYN
jgi:hypothetical protein